MREFAVALTILVVAGWFTYLVCRRPPEDPESNLPWQQLHSPAGFKTWRQSVPKGWIVVVEYKDPSIVYVPDENHSWSGQ